METGERPSTDLNWYLDQLRRLMLAINAPPHGTVLISEEVRYGPSGLPCALGRVVSVDDYHCRFAELLARRWDWINLHALGLLGTTLIVSVELPSSAGGVALFTSVNLSGPIRAIAERNFGLGPLLEEGGHAP